MAGTSKSAQRRARASTAREKAAEARAAMQARERRRRLVLVASSAVAVLAVIAGLVVLGITSGHGTSSKDASRTAAPKIGAVISQVPQSTLDGIGKGSISSGPKTVSGSPLTRGGKPEVLYVGAEFCPYCAAERWAIAQALSRFGTFTGLSTIHSSPTDQFANTATLSFYGASYRSSALAFVSREVETVTGAPLEQPSKDESALWHRFTGTPGSFPFVDIGGRYVITAPSYDPGVLKGLTAAQIAADLADAASQVAQAVDGTANVITAAICRTTQGAPASVCTARAVTTAASSLSG